MRRLALIVLVAGCLGPQDDPSQLHDLRVIGASFEPPELMANCAGLLSRGPVDPAAFGALLPFLQPVQMKWLVLDPNGGGRAINWELRTCSNQFDRECDDGDGSSVRLAASAMQPGELGFSQALATVVLPVDGGFPSYCPHDGGSSFLPGCADGGAALVFEAQRNDTYQGLGGIRVPVVLHVSAGTEHVYAQKLMVYTCQLLAEQKPNVTPIIPGLTLFDEDWPESPDGGANRVLNGLDPSYVMKPNDFEAGEEEYVVPSLELKPVHLEESWKFSWHATLGRFTPTTSGGTDFTGALNKPRSEWLPRIDGGTAGLTEQDVTFYVIVRDGRGGESWLTRKAHFIP